MLQPNLADVDTYPLPTLRLIDRDLPATGGDEDIPIPLGTLVGRMEAHGDDPPVYSVERFWEATAARRCRLCPLCEAVFFASGFAACKVHGQGTIADADAPLHQRAISSVAS